MTNATKATIDTGPDRPQPLAVNADGIAAELRDCPQWVGWRYERREKGGKAKWTKVPLDPRTGRMASATDRQTWATFAEAMEAYHRKGWDGVGFVFTSDDPYCGIDLDDAFEPESGSLKLWAAGIVRRLDTYTEVSPSGTGVKLFLRGRKPGDECRRACDDGEVEVYDSGRYFALTGILVDGSPATVNERQQQLDPFYRELFPNPQPRAEPRPSANGTAHGNGSLDDAEIILRASNARNGAKFSRLWSGDTGYYGGDDSRADLALCTLLAFWSQDAQQIDRLFRQSGLYRPKWDERRGENTYGHRTIQQALQRQQERYRHKRRAYSSANGRFRETMETPGHKPHGQADDDTETTVRLTDRGNALRLASRFGTELRFCHPWRRWFCWDGKRWKEDDTGATMRRAKQTLTLATADAAKEITRLAGAIKDADDESVKIGLKQQMQISQKTLTWLIRSEAAERLKAMITVAQSDPPIPILPDMIDRDQLLLNCPNGTLDLRTGKLLEHRRENYFTRLCPVPFDSFAICPLWEKSLAQIFAGDPELIEFLRRLVGLFMTGDVTEHLLIVFHGNGANGKTLLLNILLALLGADYSVKCPPDLFLWRKGDAHPTERAILHGKRLAVCSETPQGRHLNESLVKELTGGEKITARRMREDFWTFDPTHKLVIATNYKPAISGDDDGIWRRVRLVPFGVQFWDADDPNNQGRDLDPALRQNKRLFAELKAELPGILAWGVRGCLAWQRDGLTLPAKVRAATSEYRQSEDRIGRFLMERCITGPDYRIKASELYAAFKKWCEATGEHCPTQTTFGEALGRNGFERYTSNGTWYRGIDLRDIDQEQDYR